MKFEEALKQVKNIRWDTSAGLRKESWDWKYIFCINKDNEIKWVGYPVPGFCWQDIKTVECFIEILKRNNLENENDWEIIDFVSDELRRKIERHNESPRKEFNGHYEYDGDYSYDRENGGVRDNYKWVSDEESTEHE